MTDFGIFRSKCLDGTMVTLAGVDRDSALGAITIVHPS